MRPNVKIPEGYEELKKGDIILADDLAYKNETYGGIGNWKEERTLLSNFTSRKYKDGCYLTVRKIENSQSIEISEEEKQSILENLIKNRALNADSGFFVNISDKNYSLYKKLETKGIIKSIVYDENEGGRYFYIKKI